MSLFTVLPVRPMPHTPYAVLASKQLLVVATPYNQAVLQSSTMYPQFHDAGDLWFSQVPGVVCSCTLQCGGH